MAQAETKLKVELDVLERQYVVVAIKRMREQTQRARNKAVPGSEIWRIMGEEDLRLEALARKCEAV